MEEKLNVIKQLNKKTLAERTGISYSKLRKYASGLIMTLTPEEEEKIYFDLASLALIFKPKGD